MKLAAIAAASMLAACAAPGETPRVVAVAPAAAPARASVAAPPPLGLRNPGFEADPAPGRSCAPAWDCTMHNNPEAFRFSLQESGAAGGRRAFCVERVADEPWALVTQALQSPAFRNQRVRLSMSVSVEGVTGEGAGPWLLSQGGHAHAQKLLKGPAGWQRAAVELSVPADSVMLVVGATLEGPGRACFDDVVLEALPRKPS